jgi:radical SAM superfamily enzyme YgiQ (UPF0313 family)
MKKVLLVNCNTEKIPYPVPPLGLGLIAATLENHYSVRIYDGMFDEGVGLVDTVTRYSPDYIGFSIRNIDSTMSDNPVFYFEDQVSRFILPLKKITSAIFILGGSGFSIFPHELIKLSEVDYGIVGEGEVAFLHLITLLERGESMISGENIVVNDSRQRIKKTNQSQENNSTLSGSGDKLVYPVLSDHFSEIDLRIDFNPYKERGAYPIQTKRGCAHACIYCTYPALEGHLFRTRNPIDIVDEIEQASDRLGDIVFEFVDSTFNDPKGHAESVCREIIRRKLHVRLRTMGINPRNSSEELFSLMIEAGFVQIDATPDTASVAMLKNLGKGFDLQEVQQMGMAIRKFNLPAMWFFLFGGPGENRDTFKETLDFIDSYVNPEDLVYLAQGLRIYPGTLLEKTALQEKVIQPGQSLLFPVYYFSHMISRDELRELINETSVERMHCMVAAGTRPSTEMLKEAYRLRKEQNLTEPMFRTLLRLRKEWKKKGLL